LTGIGALSGLRALVVGLGREGTALAAYLARHGLAVAATDRQSAPELDMVLASLEEAGVSLVLGEHPLSLLDEADILFVSPGVPLEIPLLQEARARKIPLSTESRLFCHLCPAPILAVTGSSGKTTTTTLLGQMMEADGRKTWVGGNIGQPLIAVVDQIEPGDAVVMELSSFQLEYFHAELNEAVEPAAIPGVDSEALAALLDHWSPPMSAILNITPNHLDRHASMKHYIRAKRAIIDYQGEEGRIVMSLDNDLTRTIGRQFEAKTRWFSLEVQIPGGASLVNDEIVLFDQDGTPHRLAGRSEIKLRGDHNLSNILAACLMAREAGVSLEAMRQVVTSFTGVEHRLQWVRERQGVSYYNDSIATTPERLIAALRSFDEPIVLLAGGRDKHLPWQDAARLILGKTRHLILFGEATEIIAGAIAEARQQMTPSEFSLHRCVNLEEAIHLATQVARPGDVVLLSPGCASYDAFHSFAERGKWFREFVLQL
jgi:UDP-N-acetylmuramoylalanine--D-glutamate ligase